MKNPFSLSFTIYLAVLSHFLIQISGCAETETKARITHIDKSVPHRNEITIPTIDISKETYRHVIIAQGTEQIRHGHPGTLLMPNGKTIFVAWTNGLGGPVGPLKKSIDGGLTWSDMLQVPENWSQHANCPPLYLLKDPQGKERLSILANRKKREALAERDFPLDNKIDFQMYQSVSEDGGITWFPMKPTPIEGGKGYLSENSLPPTVIPFLQLFR